ncbi:hypothetical protein Goari_004348 [Gossypium aridum]|uniref:Uncharacterized protein n=1 Tax=Gossypium aridum TaxID=34290 RepID=A0A7J8Y357_GOSAI|nr:hypothetical protein [Gossypium aridum]
MASFSASASSPAIEFQEIDMDKYLQQLQPYTFIQEHGFDPLLRNCKGIWEITIEREWTKFCLPAEEPLIIPVVQEFYLALKQKEAARLFYEICSFVKFRGVNVLEFKNIDTNEVLIFLTTGKEMWTYQTGTAIPETFNQEAGVPMEQMDKTMNPPKEIA